MHELQSLCFSPSEISTIIAFLASGTTREENENLPEPFLASSVLGAAALGAAAVFLPFAIVRDSLVLEMNVLLEFLSRCQRNPEKCFSKMRKMAQLFAADTWSIGIDRPE